MYAVTHTQDSLDGKHRERRYWHRGAYFDALNLARSFEISSNRRTRVTIRDVVTQELMFNLSAESE